MVREDIGILIIDTVIDDIKCLNCNVCDYIDECVFETYKWKNRVVDALEREERKIERKGKRND